MKGYQSGVRGYRPWNSPDSMERAEYVKIGTPGYVYLQADSQREIDMCLNCKRPECINCMGTLTARQRRRL